MLKIARSPDDLADPDQVLSMSGRAFMDRLAAGEIATAPIAVLLGFAITEVDDGRVVFCGAPGFDNTNPVGAVHGGWYGALLDSAMGCAVMTTVPAGSVYTTLEYKVNITRPIPLGTEVVCEARVSHAGRSTGVAEATIRGATDNRLYATGSTTCIIMQMR